MQAVTLSPLFRHTIGFDRFNDLFESVLSGSATEANSYPPYNIEKHGENRYRITMAVAGFKREEIDIVTQDDELMISGKTREEKTDTEYLYKGIATRAFQRKFSLSDYMKVTGASLADGLLQIDLEREVPEARKPRVIEIKAERSEDLKVLEAPSKKKKD